MCDSCLWAELCLSREGPPRTHTRRPLPFSRGGEPAKARRLTCAHKRKQVAASAPSVSAEEYYLRPDKAVTVYCNVYDLAWGGDDDAGKEDKGSHSKKKKVNSGLPGMGFGIYHSGIEVYGREISFGYSDDGCGALLQCRYICIYIELSIYLSIYR